MALLLCTDTGDVRMLGGTWSPGPGGLLTPVSPCSLETWGVRSPGAGRSRGSHGCGEDGVSGDVRAWPKGPRGARRGLSLLEGRGGGPGGTPGCSLGPAAPLRVAVPPARAPWPASTREEAEAAPPSCGPHPAGSRLEPPRGLHLRPSGRAAAGSPPKLSAPQGNVLLLGVFLPLTC